MKKNGFTLIEVIGILVLLILILSITFPVVSNTIKNSKQKLYNDQIEFIKDATKNYLLDLNGPKPSSVSLQTLTDNNYMDEGIIDPRDDTPMNGCVLISFDSVYNTYDLTYLEQACPAP